MTSKEKLSNSMMEYQIICLILYKNIIFNHDSIVLSGIHAVKEIINNRVLNLLNE